jgi:thiosulfate/3-mercaptopyruvate sulfurtransferase
MFNGETVVSADEVAAHLQHPDVRVLEVDVSPAAYAEGHIPGAILWNAYADLRDERYAPVDRAELAALLSRAGVTPETTIVTYGYAAPLGLWLLREFGHANVRMLEGARSLWSDAGHEWDSGVPEFEPTEYPLPAENLSLLATLEDVQATIGDAATVLLDVRSELEFNGERFWPSGATADVGRAGHVPGAVNVPIGQLRADDESLKSPEELRQVFEAAGIHGDKPMVVYCTIGNRASQVWFGLTELLGYPDVKVYYGSWVEWGKLDDTPIENSIR